MLYSVQSQLVEMEPQKAREILKWFNLFNHNPLAFKEEVLNKFQLPKTDDVTCSLHTIRLAIKRRKLYDGRRELVHRIVSGIDGDVWVQGVRQDSLNGEGHQDMYYPLDEISPADFNRKVQQLGTTAQVKTARTRPVLEADAKRV